MSPTTIFTPATTPARWVFDLSLLVGAICAAIFLVVFGLLAYSVVKFRKSAQDDGLEPPQVYGSKQIELAWTIIPVLIVLVLFLASARVIYSTQRHRFGPNTLEVNVVGHQFWWEYRYPGLGVVTANELHVPQSDPAHPVETRLRLYSADTVHSFWVPKLSGKVDLIPNSPNELWLDPGQPGLYVGQCAQYCGVQHAMMLLRVYVEPREQFLRWIERQKQHAEPSPPVAVGRELFERSVCRSCHTIAGTAADGRFGPDLTHVMSRDTLGAGIIPNNRENLRSWIEDPSQFKPHSLMPAMGFSEHELERVTDYLTTLR
ncbi:MAG TPA: cytochrome c oxidase subunit II [Polyangiaceae bacterium]|nr:cytochrome c oxidase subunit II [Polyangiaceae bacterium]